MEVSKIIAIIHNPVPEDSPADERDVLDQVEQISMSLSDLGYEPIILPFSLDHKTFQKTLRKMNPLCIFNLVESVKDDCQLIYVAPALYDHMRISYTGASTESMFLTTNKVLAKKWMFLSQIPTPGWLSTDEKPLTPLIFPERYIIKAVWEEASVGLYAESIVHVRDAAALSLLIRERESKLDKSCFAEGYIDGREFNLSLLGKPGDVEVLPPAEMMFDYPDDVPKIMDYRAKWLEGSQEYEKTRRTFDLKPEDTSLVEKLKEIASRCWEIFHLRGYARVDFRVDREGNPYVLEINANPCLTPCSGFPAACEQAGLSYVMMIQRILDDTMQWDRG
jgi:D-alanine-D-alanine ligase